MGLLRILRWEDDLGLPRWALNEITVFLQIAGRGISETDSREGNGSTEADIGVSQPTPAAHSHQKLQEAETNSFLEHPEEAKPC